jgi:hypothetical protein
MTSRSEALWWKMLKEKDLLEMSFILAQNALPAWKNFNHSAITKEELASLPENALREIEAMLKGFGNSPKLNEHFNSFVPPVVNIRDGYLKYPYEVKLVFLSVFHILKGIISNDVRIARHAFVSSISKAIDAINIAGLLTSEEIALLTQKYYALSQNG